MQNRQKQLIKFIVNTIFNTASISENVPSEQRQAVRNSFKKSDTYIRRINRGEYFNRGQRISRNEYFSKLRNIINSNKNNNNSFNFLNTVIQERVDASPFILNNEQREEIRSAIIEEIKKNMVEPRSKRGGMRKTYKKYKKYSRKTIKK